MKQKNTFFLYINFAITIFLGAYLLFQVQPIIGKYILPWFGGTSFVWISSLLFFQILLLAGYLYSFLLTRLELKTQIYIHLTLILLVIGVNVITFLHWSSPITPGIEWKLPDSVSPVLQVLGILFISVGFTYFLLSTTSTLLQHWFGTVHTEKSPYSLYALSNTGSLLGIISYPFIIEPLLPIKTQGTFWSIAFIICAILLGMCCILTLKYGISKTSKTLPPTHITIKSYLSWFSLSAISSLILLATTNEITQAITPVPFLWLMPLGLYLLSFILCFSEKGWYIRNFSAYGFFIILPVIIALHIQPVVLKTYIEVSIYAVFLFFTFMLCHGELYHLRPKTQALNIFYLTTAFGSVIGGSIIAIIAPLFFKSMFWEFYLGLFLSTLIAGHALLSYEKSAIYNLLRPFFITKIEIYIFIISVSFLAFGIFSFSTYYNQTKSTIGVWRNFYGTLRIREIPAEQGHIACILNGKIIHGCQFTAASLRKKPLTYYSEKSGVGLAIQSLRNNLHNLRFGNIGLGAGTLAAYGKKGDTMRFYELNPLDIEIAKKYFTYLEDSQATITTVQGDGRLSLEKELKENKSGGYNLLVIDAFTDDAIPVHLLTKEAFSIYLKHLAPKNSIIAVHISTNYVDLAPVIKQIAKNYGLESTFINSGGVEDGTSPALWALLSYDKSLLTTKALNEAKINREIKEIPLWTDDYSNIFQLLKY